MTEPADDLLALLARDRATLLAEAARVPHARWGEQPAPDRWSVVEILEHVARVDTSVARLLALRAAEPVWATPDELDAGRLTPRRVAALRDPTLRPIEAPDRARPKGQVAPEGAIEHLATTRAALENAYRTADPALLDGMVFTHPFLGALTLRGWVEMAAHHDARHARQIAEIANGWASRGQVSAD
jgi:hypothetical protein